MPPSVQLQPCACIHNSVGIDTVVALRTVDEAAAMSPRLCSDSAAAPGAGVALHTAITLEAKAEPERGAPSFTDGQNASCHNRHRRSKLQHLQAV